MREKGKLR